MADNWDTCPNCKAETSTFREDYEMGMLNDGGVIKFFVDYRGECRECDYRFTHNHEERIR